VRKRNLLGGLLLLALPWQAGAELNVQVAARVVSFLQPPPNGAVQAAIVFEPGNAVSEADATSIERAIGGGVAAGRASIRTRRVPISSLGNYRAAFVTAGLRDEQPGIAAAAARGSVVTITSDQACVQAARCVVGISSTPRVQITVSRAAARATNVRFGSAFLMLVKEI
jgi:hypothetical protein